MSLTPSNRIGFKSHFSFGMAKEFRDVTTKEKYIYPQNCFEKVGHYLRIPVGKAVDLTFQEMRNPVAIVGAASIAATVVTIAFYPDELFAVVPLLYEVKPWMVKLGVFLTLQTTILGLGMRAYGHFGNYTLYEAWRKGQIEPVHIGEKRIR